MKEKCPFYAEGKCLSQNDCEFRYYYYAKPQCKKGGVLK